MVGDGVGVVEGVRDGEVGRMVSGGTGIVDFTANMSERISIMRVRRTYKPINIHRETGRAAGIDDDEGLEG